jgi:hypothetical protein
VALVAVLGAAFFGAAFFGAAFFAAAFAGVVVVVLLARLAVVVRVRLVVLVRPAVLVLRRLVAIAVPPRRGPAGRGRRPDGRREPARHTAPHAAGRPP